MGLTSHLGCSFLPSKLGRVFNQLREEYKYRRPCDEAEECAVELFIASADPSRTLQFLEEVFDEVALLVGVFVDVASENAIFS